MSSSLAVETVSLGRSYGSFQALRDVDLRIPTGSIFGLIGPNGAGKTTAFSILAGFLRPTTGSVRVLGHDPRDRAALGARVGALPQDAPLPARMTTLQVMRYLGELGGLSRGDARAQADRWLAAVGLADQAAKQVGALSHGMGKRVALAQAFLGDPELVLLDEPTSGLDPRTAYEIKQVLRAQRGRRTLVVSSHDLAQLEELCDAVAILDHGRLVQQGTLAEVTGQGERVRVALADAPGADVLAAVRALASVESVEIDEARGQVEVRLRRTPIEDAIPGLLRVLLEHGARPIGVTRGQKLEERVLELT